MAPARRWRATPGISFNYPSRSALELNLGAFIYARNGVVDEARHRLKTISANLAFRSATSELIDFGYERGARYSCASDFDPSESVGQRFSYIRWPLTSQEKYWMFTGLIRNVQANAEEDFGLGLPIGSDGRQGNSGGKLGLRQGESLDFYAGAAHHCILQFALRVVGRWQ